MSGFDNTLRIFKLRTKAEEYCYFCQLPISSFFNKTFMRTSIFLLLIIFFTSCEGIKVTNQWDKEVDFSQFKTYSLYPWDTYFDKVVNDYDKQTIQFAVKDEMEKRGYTFVEKDGELVVSTFVVIEDKTSYQAYTNHYGGWAGYGGGWGYGPGMGYYGYGWGPGYSSTTVYSTDYKQGTLIIDVFRLSNKKLIWQGIGSGEVTQDMEKRDKRLPVSISSIFKKFPVRPKKQK